MNKISDYFTALLLSFLTRYLLPDHTDRQLVQWEKTSCRKITNLSSALHLPVIHTVKISLSPLLWYEEEWQTTRPLRLAILLPVYLPFPDYKGADITKGFSIKPTCDLYGLSVQRRLVKTREKKPEVFGAMETEQLTNVHFPTSAGTALEPIF